MRVIDAPHIPTAMPTANRPINAGVSMDDDASRLDGPAKVTGLAKYGKDMHLERALYAALVRCPYGAGTLSTIDQAKARAVPGVVEVEVNGREGEYHGQSIGFVAAESPLALARGLRALGAKWKRTGPIKTRIEDAEPAPKIGARGDGGIESAAFVHEAVYSTPVQTHSSLETHGGCVDHTGSRAVVYASTQGTSSVRDGLGRALGLRDSEFEIVCEFIGGGFGSKLGGPGKEITTAARIAASHKRPVYLFCDRKAEHLDTGNRPASRTYVRVGVAKDGSIVGGEIRTWGSVGVGRGGGGVNIPSGRYSYNVSKNHTDVSTNAGGPRPFRAPGRPQGVFAEELMLDEVAARAGVEPLDLRRRLVKSDRYREMLDLGARMIGWKDRKANGAQRGVVRVGFGVGTTDWGSPAPGGSAEVVINRDGSIESRTGTQDIGTGQRTTMGIVTANAIGVPLRMVNVSIGRSSLPPGPGSGGSVTSPMTAPTMMAAAGAAKDKLLEHVASQPGAKGAKLGVVDGEIVDVGRGNARVMSWAEACATLPPEGVRATGEDGEAERGRGGSEGVQFVRIEVDSETGVVRVKHVVAIQSCGRVICRKTAESQIIGGVIQGVSYALFENKILDRNTGTMVNANLEWYKILGSEDMPHIEPVLWAKDQTGVRSLGEPPTIPTAGAIACALFNAIGRPVRDLPLTPDKVLAALEGGEE